MSRTNLSPSRKARRKEAARLAEVRLHKERLSDEARRSFDAAVLEAVRAQSLEDRLRGLSANALEALAAKATRRAKDLRAEQPSYELALAAGVVDDSYKTVRWGWISSYYGSAVVTMDNGTRWRCIGHKPIGDAEYVRKEGYIEFIKLDPDEAP